MTYLTSTTLGQCFDLASNIKWFGLWRCWRMHLIMSTWISLIKIKFLDLLIKDMWIAFLMFIMLIVLTILIFMCRSTILPTLTMLIILTTLTNEQALLSLKLFHDGFIRFFDR